MNIELYRLSTLGELTRVQQSISTSKGKYKNQLLNKERALYAALKVMGLSQLDVDIKIGKCVCCGDMHSDNQAVCDQCAQGWLTRS